MLEMQSFRKCRTGGETGGQEEGEGRGASAVQERLLLTWLIEEPSLYARIKDIIGPEDFVKPLYKEAAKAVFEGLEAGNVNPAAILNRFIDDEGNYKRSRGAFQCKSGRILKQ